MLLLLIKGRPGGVTAERGMKTKIGISPDERDKCLIRKISLKKTRNFSVRH